MNMIETLLGIAILFLVIAYSVDVDDRVRLRTDSRAGAALVVDLHEAGEAYLKGEYSRLVECFGGAPGSVVPPAPGEAMDYVLSVPLYEVPPATTGVFGDDGDAVLGPECTSMRSFQEVGLLPPALGALTYADENDEASEESPWSPAQLVFRYLVRRVNYGNEDYGIQGILVVRSPNGVRLAPDYMRELMVATSLPEVGLLDTTSPGADNGLVRGLGGGWELNVCTVQSLSAGDARFPCPSTFSAADMRRIDVLSLDHPSDPDDVGKKGEYAVLHAFRDHGSDDDVPMTGGFDGGPSSARLITVAELTRDTALRNVLYRTDIGIPGANRLQVPIDMGGFGFFNAAYLVGTDSDGDGQVDTGPQILGVPSGNDQTEHPTRVYGDLIVTGSLVVGQASPPSISPSQPNGLPETGGLILARNMQLGDPDGPGDPNGPSGNEILELADVFSGPTGGDPNGALWVQRVQVGQGASGTPFGGTGSLASADAAAGRIFAQAVQLGQNDYQDAMHAAGTDGFLYARNAQLGQPAVDSGVHGAEGRLYASAAQFGHAGFQSSLNEAGADGRIFTRGVQAGLATYDLEMNEADNEGLVFARNAQLGQREIDPVISLSSEDGRLYVTAAQVGRGVFDQGLNGDFGIEDADGRIYAQGLQAGLDEYDTFLSREDSRGLVFARNAQLGQPEIDPEVVASDEDGRLYVTAAQVGLEAFDPGLNRDTGTEDADGRIYAQGLQAGLDDYDTILSGEDNRGLVFARNAQLGQPEIDLGMSGSADAGRLYVSALQVGRGRNAGRGSQGSQGFDTGLNADGVTGADGRIYAQGVQVGLREYDDGMDGSVNEGLVFARNAQLGQDDVDEDISDSDDEGRLYVTAAQFGHATFQSGLNDAGADGRIFTRGVQAGLATYSSSMNGDANEGLVFARNAQLGQSAVDTGVSASSGDGRLYVTAAQVGRSSFDVGLNAAGSDGRVFTQGLQAGLTRYDTRLNLSSGLGGVFARNIQAGGSSFSSALGQSANHGRLYATTAQVGDAAGGFDSGLADGETLLAGLTRVGSGLRVAGPSVEIRTGLPSQERRSSEIDTESPPVTGLDFYAADRLLSGSPSSSAGAVLQFAGAGTAGSVHIDSLDVESPIGEGSLVSARMKVDHLLPRIAVAGYESAQLDPSVPADPTCLPPITGSVTPGKFAIPHGWRTSQVPYEFTINLTLSVEPHGEETATLGPFRDPYVGWSTSDQTGGDDSIGRAGIAQVVSSFFLLCDYV